MVCQSGEISPNLVALAMVGAISQRSRLLLRLSNMNLPVACYFSVKIVSLTIFEKHDYSFMSVSATYWPDFKQCTCFSVYNGILFENILTLTCCDKAW